MGTVKPGDFDRRADAIIAAAASGDPGADPPAHDSRLDPAGSGSAADDTMELPLLRGERLAGRVLTRVVVSTGLLTAMAATAAAALAWLGIWEPLVALVVLLVLAALSWRASAAVPTRALPVWSALILLVVSLGATTWAGLTHDEQVLPRAEAGVNAQAAISLAQRHQWPIPLSVNEIGGPGTLQISGVTIANQDFRRVGSRADPGIEPLTPIGAPAWLSVGYWAGGVVGMLWVPAVFGGLAVLAVGLLTSSVVGPRWGPLAALSTAMCFPVLYAARATSADIIVVFLLCSGLLVLVAATRAGARGLWRQAQAVGFLAAALVASGALFRLDAVGQTVMLVPFGALLVVRREGAGARVLWGAGVTTAVAALAAVGLSPGLLQDQRGTLIPLGLLGFGFVLVASAMVVLARRGTRLPDGIRAVLPASVAALATVGGLALLVLPSRQGLVWTSWWTGPWALAITLLVVVAASYHLMRAWVAGERLPGWTGAIVVGLGVAVLHWSSPAGDRMTPWVAGGLVVTVPLVTVCTAAAVALVTRWTTRHLPTVAVVVASVGTVATLLVPEVIATLPHAAQGVSQGQVVAVRQVCRAFGAVDVVLMLDDRAAEEWLPTVRASCGVPALSLTAAARHDPLAGRSAVALVAQAVKARGGRLVVLAAGSVAAIEVLAPGPVTKVGMPVAAVSGSVTQDPVHVSRRPDKPSPIPLQVWLAAIG